MKEIKKPFLRKIVRILGFACMGFLLVLVFIYISHRQSPYLINLEVTFLPPFQSGDYLLGTDNLGRDLLSRIIYGSSISLVISFSAMTLSGGLGVILGSLGGYLGNKVYYSKSGIICAIFFSVCLLYLLFIAGSISDDNSFSSFYFSIILLIASILFLVSYKLLLKVPWFRKPVVVPLDSLILRLTELFSSVPRLILILFVASFLQPSSLTLILILGFTSWTEIARLTRAEVLQVKTFPYIEAARSVGMKNFDILLRHIFPNILSTLLVAFTFGLVQMLLVESTLSFLGIGLPVESPSLGKLISTIRFYPNAWWLVVFPSVVLMAIILFLQFFRINMQYKNNPKKVSD